MSRQLSGLSSRANPPWEKNVGFDIRYASLKHQPATGQAAPYPSAPFGMSASELCWKLGLAVLVTGLRCAADGASCPAAPWEHGRQVCLCATCWQRQREAKGKREGEMQCDGMKLDLKMCSIEINRSFLGDANYEKGFLFIYKPEHIISSTNLYPALG